MTRIVQLYMSEEDHARLHRLATKAGTSASNLVRQLLAQAERNITSLPETP